ncbi:hypothetical protein TSUD_30470, partial [Trifolium subterraneum]
MDRGETATFEILPFAYDDHVWNENRAHDHVNYGRSQSRSNTDQREFRRQRNFQYTSRLVSGIRFPRQSSSPAFGRRQQGFNELRRLSEVRKDQRKEFIGCSNLGRMEDKNLLVYGYGKEKGELGDGKFLDADKRKRNRLGEPYGFVKFSNVRDVAKMTRALNDVWFGHYRVFASVAKFERNDTGANRRPEKEKARFLKRTVDALTKDGAQTPKRHAMQAGGVVRTKSTRSKPHNGGDFDSEPEPSFLDGVRVGDIVVKLGPRQELVACKEDQEKGEGLSSNGTNILANNVKEQATRILLRNYQTKTVDMQWARNEVVATVINGEAISVVQSRITDASFNDLVIIPMGADKVFVRSVAGVDAMTTVSNAKESFKLVFSNWMRWENDVLPYRRGAWVRLYGVPMHAWNINFFKLCVFDCGRFLRADSCSAENDRLDFARVLIATPDLDIIKRVEMILVDGSPVEIKIVEEWGYAMGEDTCLFEEENELEESPSEYEGGHEEEEEDGVVQVHSNVVGSDKPDDIAFVVGEKEGEVGHDQLTGNLGMVQKTSAAVLELFLALQWQADLPSQAKRDKKEGQHAVQQKKLGQPDPKRRKAGGLLRYPIHSLKKVARLPSEDRVEVLKVLKKNILRRRSGKGVNRSCSASCQDAPEELSSSKSITNDWQNWVAMQGNDRMVMEDVRGIGNSIGEVWEVYRRGRSSTLWGNSSHAFSYRPSVGASAGLLTLWDTSEVEVWSTVSCEHVMWCHGWFTKNGDDFFVANVYAPCEDGAKQGLWVSLAARIQSLERQRICVCGDFNAVKHIDERRSSRGGARSLDHIHFSRFIEDNNLIDLPLSGRKYTWFKGDDLTMSRLDRFLLSEEWCVTWPSCNQVARMRGLSDHCSLVLSTNVEEWGPRPSRMLKCWRYVPSYNLFVRDKWNSFQVEGSGGFVLKEKFKMIKATLKDWHLTHVQNLPSRIESLKARLSTLVQKGEDEVLSDKEIDELHGEGDANSKYFHSILTSRHRRNALSVIQEDGVILEGVTPIRQAVFLHFASHFKAMNVERPGVENLRFKRLPQLESSSLTKPFSEEEVKSAMWDCDSYKSPVPDGINFGFIKDFWAELRGDVMRFISEFHRNRKLTRGLNSTFIALIPKIDSPQRLNDFRPISLVGSLYKILAKVLANRLHLVIGCVISESQSAFVKDRQILDVILIANEVVDETRKSKKELMLFKVDFEKAYDSVDWVYLDEVMGKMYFPTLWRKWIKECVCTATASVLVNGNSTEEFPLERGLRQGDPLSPFLFLLAAEGLHVLMEAMVDRHLLEGYRVGECDPVSVSHLQFADDTLLLGVKSWANVRALRVVLVLFETMSDLKVNFSKSMLVGVNIFDSWLGEAASALCCKVGKILFLYLGLPIGGDPRRLSFWDPVLARFKKRLSGWKIRFFSFGGRLILLKSVLTSLPVYALSFFKAPSGIISSI